VIVTLSLITVLSKLRVSMLQLIHLPASSSGVPEVMGFLNGNVVHGQFTLVAFVVKFISCSAGVSAGLPMGPEGPMVTIGFVFARYFQLNIIYV